MANDYSIKIGIDATQLDKSLGDIELQITNINNAAKASAQSMTEAMTAVAKSGDALADKFTAGAEAAIELDNAAKKAGTTVENIFTKSKFDSKPFEDKVGQFVAKMRDVVGKPIDFKFNLDKASLDLLTTKMKEAKGQTEGFQIVLESARKRLSELVKGSQPFNELSKQIQEADKFLNVLLEDVSDLQDVSKTKVDPVSKDAPVKAKSLKAELKEIKLELAALDLAGDSTSDRLKELTNRGAEIQDVLDGASERIKGLATDTKALDAGITAVRGLAGAFAIGQGALAAFGAENEQAAAAIQKVQGAMAILQGIQEIANVLNRDSNLIVYLQSLASKQRTAALVQEEAAIIATATANEIATDSATIASEVQSGFAEVQGVVASVQETVTAAQEVATVVTEAQAVATEGAAAATSTWTLALLANPIVLITAAVVAATAAIYLFATSQDDATLSTDELTRALKNQQEVAEEQIRFIDRLTNLEIANAQRRRATESELTAIKIKSLQDRRAADEDNLIRLQAIIDKTDNSDKESVAKREEAEAERTRIIKDATDVQDQLQVARLEREKQIEEETNSFRLSVLQNRATQLEAERQIAEQGRKYANEIQQSKIAELKDGQEKEIAILKASVAERINAIDSESSARVRKLEQQRKELDFDLETDKRLLDQRKAGLDRQIQLERESGAVRNQLKAQLTEAGLQQELEIIKRYQNERNAFELQIQGQLLAIQEDSEEKRLAILTNAAEKEILAIRAKGLSIIDEERAIDAVLQKLDADSEANMLQSSLDRIELERITNRNLLETAEEFNGKSVGMLKLKNIALLREDAIAAQRKLDALRASGKKEMDLQVQQAIEQVNAANKALAEASKKVKPTSLLELLLPGSSKEELANISGNIQSTFNSISQAVDSYSKIVQEKYQNIVDAKKKAVEQDEEAISTLQEQLQKEIELRDAGFANNVNNILEELRVKKESRDKDIKEQEEAQKQLEKSQKAQATAQTALQAANLITASTNIYLQATAIGGPFAVPIAIGAIAAMLGAFVISKAKTADAVQSFGGGGEIQGKSHAEGGQRYYAPDNSGGVVELEEGEYVTNRKATERFKPLLQAINHNKIDGMSDEQLKDLLAGLGVHIDIEKEHDKALTEARIYAGTTIVNNVSGMGSKEISSINENVKKLADASDKKVNTYEEGDYVVTQKGNKKIKVRKR